MAGVRRREIAWFFALFCLSVLVRLQLMNRPLSFHHEWVISWDLRTLRIWDENGAAKYHFAPITTNNNDADRHIPDGGPVSPVTKLHDARGDYYYVSYPPFAWLLPYFTFKLLHVRPDVLPMQIFNLALHLFCAYFVFRIIAMLTAEAYKERVNSAALLGASAFIFAPGMLWFFSNAYTQDLFALAPFILCVYVFLRYKHCEVRGAVYLPLIFVTTFLAAYSDWPGLFLGFTLGLYCILHLRDSRMRKALVAVVLGTAASLGLTVYQYSQIAGFDAFFRTSLDRFLFRSGVARFAGVSFSYSNPKSWISIAKHIAVGYLPVLIILFILVVLHFRPLRAHLNRGIIARNRGLAPAFFLCAFPTVIYHMVFFSCTVIHDFLILKTCALVSLLVGILYHKVATSHAKEASVRARFAALNLLVVALFALGVAQYTVQNHHHDKDVLYYKTLGETIARTAKKNEVIFMRGSEGLYCPEPQLMWYAHRNIAWWDDEEKARALIRMNSAERGIIFDVNNPYDPKVLRVSYIYPSGTRKCADISTL